MTTGAFNLPNWEWSISECADRVEYDEQQEKLTMIE